MILRFSKNENLYMQKFTSNDLLLYLSNELSAHTRQALEQALLSDLDLQSELHQLEESVSDILAIELEPSAGCIQHILSAFRREDEMHLV